MHTNNNIIIITLRDEDAEGGEPYSFIGGQIIREGLQVKGAHTGCGIENRLAFLAKKCKTNDAVTSISHTCSFKYFLNQTAHCFENTLEGLTFN